MTCQKGYPAYGSVALLCGSLSQMLHGRAVGEGEGWGGATKDWASLTQRQRRRRRRRRSPAWDM